MAACQACELAGSRTQTVFADGLGTRRVMFIGEAPGADEDRTGVPFVGRAGQLLTDIITKGMGLRREDVYIANVLKCRPPGNRDPLPSEKELCTAWLDRQIEIVDPAVLIPLGRHAACHVLGVDAPLGRLRGKVHDRGARKVVPTYHPAYLLRSPHDKRKTWEDIQLAMREAGIPLP
ncbi:MAG: uracil-DNA glycosylase [Planctomycetota bacterium]